MQKTLYVPAIDADVIVARRKGTRHIRISMRSDGKVRLSVPWMVTENQAIKFLIEKSEWINKHKKTAHPIRNNDHIGKSHRISFVLADSSSVRTLVKNNQIVIKLPYGMEETAGEAQKAAHKAAERALAKEAATLLPQRLKTLADKHGIDYRSLTTKKLKSRWGSCDNRKNIILNIYLMQLDWILIDYVILHELAHTKHQHHQGDFWGFLETMCPDYKDRRKVLKQKPTAVIDTKF